MKKFLKSLSLVMALVMCFTMVFTAVVSADGANPAITFGVADSVEPGAVSITVDAANFADVAGVQGEITVAGLDDAAVVAGTIDNVVIDAGVIAFAEEGEANDEGTKLTMAGGTLFTITGTAVEGTNITLAWTAAEIKACDTAEKLLTLDYADKTVEVKKAVVEPTVDNAISITANIAISDTIYVTYVVDGLSSYQDFYLEVTSDERIDSNAGFAYATKTDTFTKAQMTPAGTRYAVQLSGIAMFEMNAPLTATVYGVDADGKERFSTSYTKSIKDLAVEYYNSTSNNKFKVMLTELLNLGAEAQEYFASRSAVLPNIALPNAGFEGTPIDGYGELATTVSGAENVNNVLNYAINPGIRYDFKNATSATKMVLSYVDPLTGKDVVTEITPDTEGVIFANNTYYYQYQAIAFYAGNKTVTATVYAGEDVLYTHTYCLETILNANVDGSGSLAELAVATAKFGKACQAYYADRFVA